MRLASSQVPQSCRQAQAPAKKALEFKNISPLCLQRGGAGGAEALVLPRGPCCATGFRPRRTCRLQAQAPAKKAAVRLRDGFLAFVVLEADGGGHPFKGP